MSVRKMYEQLIGSFYKSVFSLLGGTGMEFSAQSSDYCLQIHDYTHYKIIRAVCCTYLYELLIHMLVEYHSSIDRILGIK